MPVFCFKADDIGSLHKELTERKIEVEEIVEHNWFKEFDLYDCDKNKLKIWKPNK